MKDLPVMTALESKALDLQMSALMMPSLVSHTIE